MADKGKVAVPKDRVAVPKPKVAVPKDKVAVPKLKVAIPLSLCVVDKGKGVADKVKGTADKGKGKAVDTVSYETPSGTMKNYIIRHHPVITVRSEEDLQKIFADIVSNTTDAQPWAGLETAVLSTAVFRLGIKFRDQPNGSVAAMVPLTISTIPGRVRHLEMFFPTKPERTELSQGPTFSQVSRGMKSLRELCPQLESFVIHLCVNVTRKDNISTVAAGDWMGDAESILKQSTFKTALTHMIRRAKDQGPGRKKIFKLSVECRVEGGEGGEVRGWSGNRQPIILHSDDFEFGALSNPDSVIDMAWDNIDTAAGAEHERARKR